MERRIPNKINVLLVGGGGREHALAWKMRTSKRLGKLWISDSKNAALAKQGAHVDVPVDPRDPFRLEQFCKRNDIGLAVIGPEDPLAAGLGDVLRGFDVPVFGPNKDGARLEADKAWAKQLLRSAAVPMAEGRVFNDPDGAKSYITSRSEPFVVKASGLAKGKGVIVPNTIDEAVAAVDRLMVERVFGAAGDTVVIEERLQGVEASVLALVDGRTIYVLEPCQDHKRLHEGGVGPNTGGMGAYCPAPVVDDPMMRRIEREILLPTVDALRREGIDYRGVLYAGLMLTPAGPKVLEYNVRFGDPECQPMMVRLKGDLVEILWRTATASLHEASIDWDRRTACCTVLASRGYPEKPETGFAITGLDQAAMVDGVTLFHAGTTRNKERKLITSGGRVLGVTALGDDLSQARERANRACELIHFEGKQYRTDIGAGAMQTAEK